MFDAPPVPRWRPDIVQLSSLLVACLSLGQLAWADEDTLAAMEAQQREIFERIAPSVVCIASGDRLGSGFVVNDDGTVLTNAHVVGSQEQVKFVLYDGRSGTAPVIERAVDDVDLALVKLPHEDVPPVSLAAADDLHVGDWVASIGHGHGGIWTFNTGMVANIYPDGAEHPVFQTQIPLNPGASGGPIFDRLGRVVGIVVAGDVEANNVNFGLKIDIARRSLDWIGGGWRPAETRTLTVEAPQGVAVFVDGVMVGTGPVVTVGVEEGTHQVFAIIDGRKVDREVDFPTDRVVVLE